VNESKFTSGVLAELERRAQPRPVYLPDPGRADPQPRPSAPRNFGSVPEALGRTSSVTPTASREGVVPDSKLEGV
jgi:hypothetical protein